MIFLIEYNRNKGALIGLRRFEDAERQHAKDMRLALELDLHNKGIDHEVVLLEAESEEALHRTHRRYFGNFNESLKSAADN